MNLYTTDGWLNIKDILNLQADFIFIVGARGIGKSYGSIKQLIDSGTVFMYARRTAAQASTASNPLTSDITKPLRASGKAETFKTDHLTKTIDGLYMASGEEISEKPFAYVTSISTGSNLRGFNGDAIEVILFDEFIAQPEEKPIREEANAFLNLYETVNRNREILGRKAVKVLCLANSFNLANPMFIKLGLVEDAEKMRAKNREVYLDKARGVAIIQPLGSPISVEKQNTALYKLVGAKSDFAQMAIGNAYLDDFSDNIKSQNLAEYKALVKAAEICIYKHKSKQIYYVSLHTSGAPADVYGDSKHDRQAYKRKYLYLWQAFLSKRVYFESYLTQVLFDKLYI